MREETWLNEYVFTVTDFLTAKECEQYIHLSEEIGYEEATVNSPEGTVLRTDVRNNRRVMFKNEQIADLLWERAIDFAPSELEGRSAIGVNEMLRFYRYEPGQQFDWHQDFSYERDNGECSFLTLMVYLSDVEEGGETSFEDSYSEESFDEFSVEPKAGMALFFQHETHHKGEPVRQGLKYVLRTDVMYASDDSDDHDFDFNKDDDGLDDNADDEWYRTDDIRE